MKENVAYQKAFDFAIKVYGYCKWLKTEEKEYDLARQLLKSGTSIGANLAEANGAISGNDFSSKISIAYKETLETQFWLKLLKAVGLMNDSKYELLFENSDEIGRILFAIIKTTRINNQ
ncbi:four helix bundle protein [Marinilabilia salmonicolor]|uniref:four helix bundle protein n=1 Tax=Marinilabilia salmonicolor TaxID=989 RepID=UPI00029AB856|nr:four helix bundle protein [Marinilabilia salmonicolor]